MQQPASHYKSQFWRTMGLSFLLILVSFAILFFILDSMHFQPKNFRIIDVIPIVTVLGIIVAVWWLWWHASSQRSAGQTGRLSNMLRTSQQQSEIIIQSIDDGVVVFDTAGKINLINPAAARLTQWNSADAVGIDVHLVMKLAHEDGKPLAENEDIFNAALTNKQHLSRTLRLAGQSNKQIVISLVVSPISVQLGEEVVGGVAVFRDVTKDRELEEQRSDFISTASHEMRTPVAAIEGYLGLALNEKVSSMDSKTRSYVEKAHESTEYLGKLFQNLLTSARAEDGRLGSHPITVELGDLLKHLADDLRMAAQKKQLTLEFITGENTPVSDSAQGSNRNVQPLYYVFADPDRLREVILNLADNAIKYTDHGKVTVGLGGDDTSVQLSVNDTGIGIPVDDVPHLFQKFYRVDNAATRNVGGNGLGLFISRKIIELYRGRIWVESQLGKGSTFYVSLPRLNASQIEQRRSTDINSAEQSQKVAASTTVDGS